MAKMVFVPKSKVRKKVQKRRAETASVKREVQEVSPKGPSPKWYVFLMFGLMAVGIMVILLNYVGVLPGGTGNRYLLGGLAGIAVGFTMTLGYR